MTFDALIKTPDPDRIEDVYVKAIWYDLHNNWKQSHEIVQDLSTTYAQWIHAYLHRKEGDIGNSQYWYRRAGKSYPGNLDFNEEIQTIFNEIVSLSSVR